MLSGCPQTVLQARYSLLYVHCIQPACSWPATHSMLLCCILHTAHVLTAPLILLLHSHTAHSLQHTHAHSTLMHTAWGGHTLDQHRTGDQERRRSGVGVERCSSSLLLRATRHSCSGCCNHAPPSPPAPYPPTPAAGPTRSRMKAAVGFALTVVIGMVW